MNETLASNLHILAMSAMWFTQKFGINTDEFITAINGSTLCSVHEYYQNKGIEFDIEKVEIEEGAMLYAYDKIMRIAKLASVASALGMTPEDFED